MKGFDGFKKMIEARGPCLKIYKINSTDLFLLLSYSTLKTITIRIEKISVGFLN